MMFKQLLAIAAAISPFTGTFAARIHPRQIPGALTAQDTAVVQLALFLEHLEFNFYSGGFNNFTDSEYTDAGFPDGFREEVNAIASQENTHAETLFNLLQLNGITPLPSCEYSFPYNSTTTFVELANGITTVGIGAYLGGALSLIDNPNLLTEASSILTNEARHDSYLRYGLGASPFPTPFDTSLTAVFAYNLALAFVTSCPTYLDITTLPRLTFNGPNPPSNLMPPVAEGTELSFTYERSNTASSSGDSLYIGFVNQQHPIAYEKVSSTDDGLVTVPVPSNTVGVAFAFLTNQNSAAQVTDLSTADILAGPAEVILS